MIMEAAGRSPTLEATDAARIRLVCFDVDGVLTDVTEHLEHLGPPIAFTARAIG